MKVEGIKPASAVPKISPLKSPSHRKAPPQTTDSISSMGKTIGFNLLMCVGWLFLKGFELMTGFLTHASKGGAKESVFSTKDTKKSKDLVAAFNKDCSGTILHILKQLSHPNQQEAMKKSLVDLANEWKTKPKDFPQYNHESGRSRREWIDHFDTLFKQVNRPPKLRAYAQKIVDGDFNTSSHYFNPGKEAAVPEFKQLQVIDAEADVLWDQFYSFILQDEENFGDLHLTNKHENLLKEDKVTFGCFIERLMYSRHQNLQDLKDRTVFEKWSKLMKTNLKHLEEATKSKGGGLILNDHRTIQEIVKKVGSILKDDKQRGFLFKVIKNIVQTLE